MMNIRLDSKWKCNPLGGGIHPNGSQQRKEVFGCRWGRRRAGEARDSKRKLRPEGNLFPKGPQFPLADGR